MGRGVFVFILIIIFIGAIAGIGLYFYFNNEVKDKDIKIEYLNTYIQVLDGEKQVSTGIYVYNNALNNIFFNSTWSISSLPTALQ